MQQQSHKIAGHIVPLAGQEKYAIVGLRSQFQTDLDVLVGAPERREGQPAWSGETRRPDLHFYNQDNNQYCT